MLDKYKHYKRPSESDTKLKDYLQAMAYKKGEGRQIILCPNKTLSKHLEDTNGTNTNTSHKK